MKAEKIQLGQHIHRSLVDSTVVSFNRASGKIETDMEDVPAELVPMLRNRARARTGPNIPVETFFIHEKEDKQAAYKITTNRYGITTVPWSLVAPEDLRKDYTIIAFKTKRPGEYLTIASGDTIVGACFQNENDGPVICDAKLDLVDGLISAKVDDVYFIFSSEEDCEVLYAFRDIEDIVPDYIFAEFKANRKFVL